MNKLILLIALLSMSFLEAQELTDALAHANQNIQGTSRYRAMSGAFGALGGDLSALQINPAGSAVFLNSLGSFTVSGIRNENSVNYFNTHSNQNFSKLNLNQAGVVFVFNNKDKESIANKLTLGLAYDLTRDHKNDLSAIGTTNSSISNYFLDQSQNVPISWITTVGDETIEDLYRYIGETAGQGYGVQQAFMAYEAYILDPTDASDPDNSSYTSNIASGTYKQEYIDDTSGNNGKFTANGGIQLKDKFYLGLNLNSHFIDKTTFTQLYETNENVGSTVNKVIYNNKLTTQGSGFSMQVGGIAKITKSIRAGVSFESPTWYSIEEEASQNLETDGANGIRIIDPNVINVFPIYRLRTPATVTGSVAVVIAERGLISVDYSHKDYGSTKFGSNEGVDFSLQNADIKNNLAAASTLRIGTEWRYEKWSFRGGYSLEESPYKNTKILSDKRGFSFGTGYNFGKYKLDLGYDYAEQQRSDVLYNTPSFTNAILRNNFQRNLTLTLNMNF